MSALAEFLHMGGYAVYVWSSYAVTTAVLVGNLVAPALRRRRLEREIGGAIRRERRQTR